MNRSVIRIALAASAVLALALSAPGSASAAPAYPASCEVAGTLGPVAGLFNMRMKCASPLTGTIACRGNADPGNRVMRGTCTGLSISTSTRPLTCDYKGGFIIGFNPELWIGDQVSIVCRRSTSPTTVPIVCSLNGGGPIYKDQTFDGKLEGSCQYGWGRATE